MRRVLLVVLIAATVLTGCSKGKEDPVRETVVYPDGHIEYLDEIEVIPINVVPIEVIPISVGSN